MANGTRVTVGGPRPSPVATDDVVPVGPIGVVPVGPIGIDVTVNPRKGLWTFEEVMHLLRDCGLVVELSLEVPAAGWRARPPAA